MLNNEDAEIKLKQPGADDSEAEILAGQSVQYRLVPDTRDLLGARMLLTMTPEDGEEMKNAGDTMTPELAQKAVEKAMTESPEFKENYNEIPIFLIAQMRMQKPASEDVENPANVLLVAEYGRDVAAIHGKSKRSRHERHGTSYQCFKFAQTRGYDERAE